MKNTKRPAIYLAFQFVLFATIALSASPYQEYYDGAVSNSGKTIYLVGYNTYNGDTNLLRSTNGGSTYSDISKGADARFGSVATNDDGNQVVAGADTGVFIGTSLQKVSNLPSCGSTSGGFKYYKVGMASNGKTIAAGCLLFGSNVKPLYVSNDGGKTWNTGPLGSWSSVSVSNGGNSIIAAGADSVVITTDSGKSWTTSSFMRPTATVSGDGKTFFVSTLKPGTGKLTGSSYKSTDKGKSWEPVPCDGCLLPKSSFSGTNVMFIPGSSLRLSGALAVSTDGGKTLSASGEACTQTSGRSTTIGFSNQGNTWYYTCSGTLFKSTNDGETWNANGP